MCWKCNDFVELIRVCVNGKQGKYYSPFYVTSYKCAQRSLPTVLAKERATYSLCCRSTTGVRIQSHASTILSSCFSSPTGLPFQSMQLKSCQMQHFCIPVVCSFCNNCSRTSRTKSSSCSLSSCKNFNSSTFSRGDKKEQISTFISGTKFRKREVFFSAEERSVAIF